LASREALFFTVPGGLPLSPGLDPGTRIELRPEPSLALNLPGPRVFWSDWALNPAPDESGGGADVAAVAGRTQEGGRMAWFGFRLSQAATPRDSSRMERLVQNGISWAAGLAVATPATWPNGSRAALVVIQDVEAEFQNAIAMADVLREESLPGTFFPVSRLVMDDRDLADALTSAGEVGSQTSDHTPVAGLTYEDQLVRLRRSWTEIRGWTGQGPTGLRPPEEAFDANTLRAWAEAGGQYVLAVNQARSGSPEIHSIGRGGHVVLLPRLLKDDYNVFVQEGAMRGDRLSEAYLEGTDKLRALGGLAVVASHTQIIGEGRRPVRTEINPGCDLATVVADRAAFWSPLSEEQGRSFTTAIDIAHADVWVPEVDAGAMIDALLENVFSHTEDRVPVAIRLSQGDPSVVLLEVEDGGGGLADPAAVERGASTGNSTGLGLDIVRRTAEASGGSFELAKPGALGGARVVVRLPLVGR
jgi:hypothetical protein